MLTLLLLILLQLAGCLLMPMFEYEKLIEYQGSRYHLTISNNKGFGIYYHYGIIRIMMFGIQFSVFNHRWDRTEPIGLAYLHTEELQAFILGKKVVNAPWCICEEHGSADINSLLHISELSDDDFFEADDEQHYRVINSTNYFSDGEYSKIGSIAFDVYAVVITSKLAQWTGTVKRFNRIDTVVRWTILDEASSINGQKTGDFLGNDDLKEKMLDAVRHHSTETKEKFDDALNAHIAEFLVMGVS